MRTTNRSLILNPLAMAIGVVLAGAAQPALAVGPQPGGPMGAATVINTTLGADQVTPSVAMDAAGDYVVVWTTYAGSASLYDIHAQRYSADGKAQGSEFVVNSFLSNTQSMPKVAMDATGDFVVVWQSYAEALATGFDIYAQRYASDGSALGSEFRVNTLTTGDQTAPSVAMDAAGEFIVAWQDSAIDGSGTGIGTKVYSADGTVKYFDFTANSYTTGNQMKPAVAMDAHGDSVIVWESYGQDGSGFGIFGQRLDANNDSGSGSEFQVNTGVLGAQTNPAVAMDALGGFTVVWQSADASGSGIYGQQFSSTGATLDTQFPVNTTTSNDQTVPAVAVDASGHYMYAWQSYNGADYDIRIQQSGGFPETTASSTVVGNQVVPALAMDATGDAIVVWQDDSGTTGMDILGRRFTRASSTDLQAGLVMTPTTKLVPFNSDVTATFSVKNNAAARAPTGIASVDSAINSATGIYLGIETTTSPSLTDAGLPVTSLGGTNWTCNAPVSTGVAGGQGAQEATCSYNGVLAPGQLTPPLVMVIHTDASAVNLDTAGAEVLANQPDSVASNDTILRTFLVDHAPTATSVTFSMLHGTSHKGHLKGADVDVGTTLNFTKNVGPSHGTLTMTKAGAYTYTPAKTFKGTDKFTFHVGDGYRISKVATVTINVN